MNNEDSIYAIKFYSKKKQIDEQKQDIELLREREKTFNDLCGKYRKIIDKALEYIYLHTTQRHFFFDNIDRHLRGKPDFKGDISELIEILKGSDKE